MFSWQKICQQKKLLCYVAPSSFSFLRCLVDEQKKGNWPRKHVYRVGVRGQNPDQHRFIQTPKKRWSQHGGSTFICITNNSSGIYTDNSDLISYKKDTGIFSINHEPVETSTAANSTESLACPSTGSGQNIGLIVNLNQPDSCEGTTFVCLNVCLLVRSFVCPLTFYIFAFFSV